MSITSSIKTASSNVLGVNNWKEAAKSYSKGSYWHAASQTSVGISKIAAISLALYYGWSKIGTKELTQNITEQPVPSAKTKLFDSELVTTDSPIGFCPRSNSSLPLKPKPLNLPAYSNTPSQITSVAPPPQTIFIPTPPMQTIDDSLTIPSQSTAAHLPKVNGTSINNTFKSALSATENISKEVLLTAAQYSKPIAIETKQCLINVVKNPLGPEGRALKAATIFGLLIAEFTSGGWHFDPDWSLVRGP